MLTFFMDGAVRLNERKAAPLRLTSKPGYLRFDERLPRRRPRLSLRLRRLPPQARHRSHNASHDRHAAQLERDAASPLLRQ